MKEKEKVRVGHWMRGVLNHLLQYIGEQLQAATKCVCVRVRVRVRVCVCGA